MSAVTDLIAPWTAAGYRGGSLRTFVEAINPARPASVARTSEDVDRSATRSESAAGPSDPDLACLAQLCDGNGAGLDELMGRHQEALHRFIFRYTGNAADAADLAQETFVRVFRKAASYHPRATVKTWIFTIALNLCRDRARREARVKWLPFLRSSDPNDDRGLAPEDTVAGNADDPGEAASFRELETAISEAVAALPPALRAPFALCVLEDHSHAEAARIMKVTPKTVEVRIYRARQQLRETLRPVLSDFGII